METTTPMAGSLESMTESVVAEHAGELRELATGFAARIRVARGKKGRREFVLEGCGRDEGRARTRCNELAAMAARLRSVGEDDQVVRILQMGARATDKTIAVVQKVVDTICAGNAPRSDLKPQPTFAEFAKQWTDGKLHERFQDHVVKKDSRTDVVWLAKYISQTLGEVPIDLVTLDHCEHVMASLPPELAPATRRHVAQVMRRVLGLAVYPARLRKDNPIPRGWLPRISNPKAKECLYPEEDAKLLGEGAIPLVRRLAYGFLAREGMRKGELASLRWADLDLERGRVKLDENKTDDPRAWALDSGVHAALVAWHVKSGRPDASAHVFAEDGVPINTVRLAEQLRRDLRKAQVLRPELQAGSKTRLALRAHDLRATFVTIALANGRSETFVADRTGHRSSQMIARYRRQARTWEEMGLGELVPLHLAIPELTELAVTDTMFAPQIAPQNHQRGWRNGRRSGFRFHRREA